MTLPSNQPTRNDSAGSIPDPSPADPVVEGFFAGAYHRMNRIILVLGFSGSAILLAISGLSHAALFLAGGSAGLLNFLWLQHSVQGVVDRLVDGRRVSRARTAFFLLRYMAMLVGAYVILKGSTHSVLYFCGGLTLPILAATLEGVYETVMVMRRGY